MHKNYLTISLFAVVVLASLFIIRRNESNKRKKLYKEVLLNLIRGNIDENENGVIMLPEKYKFLSVNNKAYFTKLEDTKVLFFPVWIGKASNVRGFLVASKNIPSRFFENSCDSGGVLRKSLDVKSNFDPNAISDIKVSSLVRLYVDDEFENHIYEVSNYDS